MKYFKTWVFFIFIFLSCANTLANTIIADRPGFSTGTYTVQPKKLNVELGYNYTKDTQTLPLVVLRTGITQKLEFNVIYDGFYIKNNEQKEFTMSSDLIVGAKYRVYESDLYNITFMCLTSLPIGNDKNLTPKNMSPLIGILWDYTLSEEVSLFGTIQGSTYYDNERVYDIQPAIGTSIAHTNKFGSYIELYSILPSSHQQNSELVLDGGFTYLLNNDIQIDINIGFGLNKTSDDFIGFGIATRF